SSPGESSPFGPGGSKHRFWQARDPNSPGLHDSENGTDADRILSPKRNSIENLMKASRVKNSSIFAREQKTKYDPNSLPVVERPLASNRPLSNQGSFLSSGTGSIRGHSRGNSTGDIPQSKLSMSPPKSSSPAKAPGSPIKSSLNKNGRYSQGGHYNDEEGVLSSDDEHVGDGPSRPLRRHAKSVTFDAKPPVVNEYEMITPDPSLASREGSFISDDEDEEDDDGFDPDESLDRDDSFDASLEDTEKTPVVLPGDWRHMDQEAANSSLADTYDDHYDDSSSPPRAFSHRSNSESEMRPLPPLPPPQESPHGRPGSSTGLSAAAEFASSVRRRSLPSPPGAAAFSKSDILNMSNNSMSLEDRLQLMGLDSSREETPTVEDKHDSARDSESDKGDVEAVEDAERHEESTAEGGEGNDDDIKFPLISRESILEKVKSQNFDDYDFSAEPSIADDSEAEVDYDPDVPIPSREASSQFDDMVADTPVNEEQDDGETDLQSIPEFRSAEGSPILSDGGGLERSSSVIRHDVSGSDVEDDDTSRYSDPHSEPEEQKVQTSSTDEDDGPPTPRAQEVIASSEGDIVPKKEHQKVSSTLPDFGSFSNEDDFHLQLQSYLGKSRTGPSPLDSVPKLQADPDFLQRASTPQEDESDEEEPGTPDSVIRHPIEPEEHESEEEVDEPVATIKAPGGTLKTRASATPVDFHTMAQTRRQVSGGYPSMEQQDSDEEPSELSHVSEETSTEGEDSAENRRESFKMKIDLPVGDIGEDLSFDLDREFDRVVEQQKVQELTPAPHYAGLNASATAQSGQNSYSHGNIPANLYTPTRPQKGYLMRQNTKVVVATSRKFSDEVDPPRGLVPPPGAKTGNRSSSKGTRDRSHTWTTEPWNGKTRRKSFRNVSSGQFNQSKAAPGPAPPLPGQESNVSSGAGDMSMIDENEENMERGRLFVKVVGVKDLDLPLPKTERVPFQLTLDNGLHCVTTAWLELNRSSPIGQEFELVVLNDLEFQLTLQTKLQPPPKPKAAPAAPAPAPPKPTHKKTNSAFGRLLTSPKKRREMERKQQEEIERAAALKAQQEREAAAAAKRANANPTAWDLLHDLVAVDGSFARAYVCLKNHERQAYGRPFVVDIPCFNEWAVESDPNIASSVKSKRGGVVRRPPYKVGKLTLQLLYVPKPKGAKDEDMPKSMSACIREMKEAEEIKSRIFEGHLSQQGGDCPYWRRRFFRLSGTKLTAYHETTRQPRATINLAKAAKLIDDRSTLTQPTSSRNGNRRKSGFAEEDEGYAFVEEGFRIRFGNGETIDFYADNAEQKEAWMKVLSDTVGKQAPSAGSKAWTELVFQKEKGERSSGRVPSYHRQQAQFQSQQAQAQPPLPNSGKAPAQAPSSVPAPAQDREEQPPPVPQKFDPARPSAFDHTRPLSYDPTRPGMYDRSTTRSTGNADKRRSEMLPSSMDKTPKHHTVGGTRTSGRRGEVKSMIF
ncbi:uncharacterized protein K452DRAFT_223987, partial [Aplosporella prunicola CBS 121167]